jgi:two-component system, OmpR family, copper resistance phosphate regulon response regulator CusR
LIFANFKAMQKILIIEDERKVANSLGQGLEEEGYSVEIAFDGMTGKEMALANLYDLIILDINLPLLNGQEVCRAVRAANENIPVLMLTALGTTDDIVSGFGCGADDYLVKPFEFRELMARIKAILKRISSSSSNVLRIADLELNLDKKNAKRAGKTIELTAKEFALLEFLLRNKGRVVTRTDIAEKIWDITFDTGTNVIDVYINFLRKKIDKSFSPRLIHTQIGMGYIMKEGEY